MLKQQARNCNVRWTNFLEFFVPVTVLYASMAAQNPYQNQLQKNSWKTSIPENIAYSKIKDSYVLWDIYKVMNFRIQEE
jgi:hypothetical protein